MVHITTPECTGFFHSQFAMLRAVRICNKKSNRVIRPILVLFRFNQRLGFERGSSTYLFFFPSGQLPSLGLTSTPNTSLILGSSDNSGFSCISEHFSEKPTRTQYTHATCHHSNHNHKTHFTTISTHSLVSSAMTTSSLSPMTMTSQWGGTTMTRCRHRHNQLTDFVFSFPLQQVGIQVDLVFALPLH